MNVGGAAIDALDDGRRWVWRQVVRTHTGRACARDRSARVLALGLGHAVVAAVLAAIAPGLLLVFGPLVLGVPHVVADVRYLVVRGPLPRELIVAVAVPLACIAGLRAVQVLGGPAVAEVEVCFGFAAIATAAMLAPGRRRIAVVAGVVALAVPAITTPYATAFVLLHGHNLVGLAIWLRWTRRTVRLSHRLAVVAAIAAIVVAVLAGGLDAMPASDTIAAFAPVLAPGLSPELAYRVVLVYVFLQAMHYVVWLRLIPATQAQAAGASTFRRSIAALRADFGRIGIAAIAIAVLAVPVLAFVFDPTEVRDVYLALALFHGWLELATIGYLIAARGRLGEP